MVRLLFDEQLSEKLCRQLSDLYPNSLHIRSLGLGGAKDGDIWEQAKSHRCIVVSKDEDFYRLAISKGAPPKLIWVRQGNGSTDDIAKILRSSYETVLWFSEQSDATVLELRG